MQLYTPRCVTFAHCTAGTYNSKENICISHCRLPQLHVPNTYE